MRAITLIGRWLSRHQVVVGLALGITLGLVVETVYVVGNPDTWHLFFGRVFPFILMSGILGFVGFLTGLSAWGVRILLDKRRPGIRIAGAMLIVSIVAWVLLIGISGRPFMWEMLPAIAWLSIPQAVLARRALSPE